MGIKIARLCLLALFAAAMSVNATIPIDDSYTISSRFARYKQDDPALTLPTIRFVEGQQVLFNQRYLLDGKRELHADVFLPVAQAEVMSPVILLIHGGGWRSGDKSHFYALANRLAQQGIGVVLPEYRLSAEASYPVGLQDLSRAITWVKANAAAWGVDPQRLSLGGGSSGGQMAALLGTTGSSKLFATNLNDDVRVNAVIDLDGVLDFTSPLALKNENKKGSQSAAALWLGGDYDTKPEIWWEASALSHIDKHFPPLLVISSGQMRFTAGKEAVKKALEAQDVVYQEFVFSQVCHTFWLFEPYLSQVEALMVPFIHRAPALSEK